MAEGDIAKAEELSDRLAIREVSGLLTKTLSLVLHIWTKSVTSKHSLKIFAASFLFPEQIAV